MDIAPTGRAPRANRIVKAVRPVGGTPHLAAQGGERPGPAASQNAAEAPRLPAPVGPAASRSGTAGLHRWAASAPLLAQLIAGRLGLPQARWLRRAAPEEASGAYAAAERLAVPPRPVASLRI